MAGVIGAGNFPRALELGINKTYGEYMKDVETQYDKIFDVSNSTMAEERDYQLEGLATGQEYQEGSSIIYDGMSQGYAPSYVHKNVGLGVIVTRNMIEDNKINLIMKLMKALKKSYRESLEVNAANILNRAFNSSYLMTGGDGKELCATDHRRGASDSTTYSNELSTPASLSEQAIEEALILIGDFRDARGNRTNINSKSLVVPTALKYEACRILKSTGQSGTANNDINAIRDSGDLSETLVNKYLKSQTAWFITTDVPDALRHFKRRAMEFKKDGDFSTDNQRFKFTYRATNGWTDPRGIVGSQGTA
jgi:phage major head subunit gpT-like protein